jgi:amidase
MSLTASSAELLGRSATDQAALVRSGEVSARELVEASLAAVVSLNPELNAFVALGAERALAEAERIRPGDPRPLCGVPLGLKDLLGATEGLPTTHGSSAFGDWVADHDTAHVRRLREAGAIVIGKTNTPELGLRPVTENARFGPTRNPWDPRLNAGGSSGGSAAAVAAGLVPLADGSDFGGSIRIPAACCGVVGIRPSTGRVSIGPDYHDVGSGVGVDGVLARTVLDVAVALEAMSGYEPGERHWLPPQPLAESLRCELGRLPVRVALDAPNGVPVDAEPRAAAARAAELLSELGHDVREEAPDWSDESFGEAWMTCGTTAMQHMIRVIERLHGRPVDPDALEPATRAWLLGAPQAPAIEYLEAGERLFGYARRVLQGWPADGVLITPTLTRLPIESGRPAQAGVTDDAVRFSAFVRVWNVTGQPALSLPLGESAGGLPVGVQIVGPPGRDDLVLAVAAQLEAAAGLRPHGRPQITTHGDAR